MEIITVISLLIFLVLCLAMLLISFYVYVIYSHEHEFFFPGLKGAIVSIVFSIFTSLMTLMVVPLDYMSGQSANTNEDYGLSLDMQIIWKVNIVLSMILFISNWFFFVYYRYNNPFRENEDDLELKVRIKHSITYVGYYLGIITCVLLPMTFVYGARVIVPYKSQIYTPDSLIFSDNTREISSFRGMIFYNTIPTTPIFVVAFATPLVFYGSFVLYFIGGFGMATVPVNLFAMWFRRPKKPDAEDMVMCDIILKEATEEGINKLKDLMETKEEIKELRTDPDHDKAALNRKIETLENEVVSCQKLLLGYEKMRETKATQHNFLEENPLKYLLALVMGVITSVVSVCILIHSILSVVNRYFFLENFFNFLNDLNMVYAMLAYLLMSFYLLFCCLKGYEKLSYLLPNHLGYNEMEYNRTWVDTWLLVVNILIPSSWAVIAYFLRLCPNFFSFMYASRLVKMYVLKVEYTRFFYRLNIFTAIFLFSFIIGVVVNFSSSITAKELFRKMEETKNAMKTNQLKFQKDMKGFKPR